MINEIRFVNFKAFQKASIDIKPITIFLGPNNSGKSSILSALRILSQTVGSYDPNVPLLLNGTLGDFGSYKDVVYGNIRNRPMEISISVSVDNNSQNRYGRNVSWCNMNDDVKMVMDFKYRSSVKETILNELLVKKGRKEILKTRYSKDSDRHVVQRVGGLDIHQSIKAQISKKFSLYHFLPNSLFVGKKSKSEQSEMDKFLNDDQKDMLSSVSTICGDMYSVLKKMEYVGAMRIPPSRTYIHTGERHNKVGQSGDKALNILVMDSMRKGSKSRNIREQVVGWLSHAGIASDLKIVALSERHFEIRIQNPHTQEYQNYADVGFGNSQVIPVLVGGYNLFKGDSYVVEEPEIHLHPKAQAELGDYFYDLHRLGVQSLVETHSEHLIVRLQQHVAKGNINPDNIAVYYIYAKDGVKRIDKMEIDKNAHFINEWPEGFFPIRLEEATKLAKLRYENK